MESLNDLIKFLVEGFKIYWLITDPTYKVINLIWIISILFFVPATKAKYKKHRDQWIPGKTWRFDIWKLLYHLSVLTLLFSMFLTLGGYHLLYLCINPQL